HRVAFRRRGDRGKIMSDFSPVAAPKGNYASKRLFVAFSDAKAPRLDRAGRARLAAGCIYRVDPQLSSGHDPRDDGCPAGGRRVRPTLARTGRHPCCAPARSFTRRGDGRWAKPGLSVNQTSTGWRGHLPLTGPQSLIVATATDQAPR